MKFKSHRDEPYFTFLKNGRKTIEGRVRKGQYVDVKSGDIIQVFNKEETEMVTVVVKRVAIYSSIREMLTKEPIKKLLPDVESVEQGIKVYRRFYTPEQEKQFGMVAIEVKKIS